MDSTRGAIEVLEVGARIGEHAELVGVFRHDGRSHEIYFRFPKDYADFLAVGAEPFLCGLLVPAMSLGVRLISHIPVSATLLRGFRRAQVAVAKMYPTLLREVPVEAPIRPGPFPEPAHRMGSFFSCGLDSFFTVITNRENPKPGNPPLTHLLFMRGLETVLALEEGAEHSAGLAREAARSFGLTLMEGESNLRSFFSVHWGPWNGTGLAATAHALGRGFGVFLIPAGSRYWTIGPPVGSHPLIDESCSTEWIRIHNDGAHCGRPNKVAAIGHNDVVLSYLRICPQNRSGPENCGRCNKCLRTMVAMEAVGALERSRTLPTRLPSDWTTQYRPNVVSMLRENIRLAREHHRPEVFIRKLERLERKVQKRNALRDLAEASWLRHLLPMVRRWRSGGTRDQP
jgi:hypothetical protein